MAVAGGARLRGVGTRLRGVGTWPPSTPSSSASPPPMAARLVGDPKCDAERRRRRRRGAWPAAARRWRRGEAPARAMAANERRQSMAVWLAARQWVPALAAAMHRRRRGSPSPYSQSPRNRPIGRASAKPRPTLGPTVCLGCRGRIARTRPGPRDAADAPPPRLCIATAAAGHTPPPEHKRRVLRRARRASPCRPRCPGSRGC
mmetsp:Transcript_129276/g.374314  ORF Transcript_129276/g.374314 Transcript_129276/m.374314 type:complete len:203 (-) Transcript_129276:221-829(-)